MPSDVTATQSSAAESNTKLIMGGVIVALGVGAVVISLWILTSHFDVETVKGTDGQEAPNTADSSNAIVAVLTPLLAGIAAIVGLYFGITASSAARKQEAATQETALKIAAVAPPEKAEAILEEASAQAPRRKRPPRRRRT